ncbi:MAG: cell division protein FtsL [Gracilibacteraceae bacterium]|jgi:cell division protein FtsL|nr:cell division protein FtsL [Gracilibacteraceae bacterium]
MTTARNRARYIESEYSFTDELSAGAEDQYVTPRQEISAPRTAGRKKKRRQASFHLSVGAVVFALFTFLAIGAICATAIHAEYLNREAEQLEKELSNLRDANDMLQIEADRLSSVERIEQAALALGMVRPANKMYVASDLLTPVDRAETADTQSAPPEAAEAEVSYGAALRALETFAGFFAYAHG